MPGINDFPLNPTNGQIYTNDDGFSWKWNGNSIVRAWEKIVLNVKTLNGLSGGVTLAAGTGITFSISGNTLTISATSITGPTGATGSQGPIGNTGPTGATPTDYVISVNGSTGTITNVAKTDANNLFTDSQTITAVSSYLSVIESSSNDAITVEPGLPGILYYSDLLGNTNTLQFTIDSFGNSTTVVLPNFDTTLAGLAGTQTFTGAKTFSALSTFTAGITASGATFSGLARFLRGITASGLTVSGPANFLTGITAPNIVNSINGLTGTVTIPAQDDIISVFIEATPDDITTGTKAQKIIPYNCTPLEWYIIAGQTGSIEFDIKRSSFANYPSTTSVVGTDYPKLVTQFKNSNTGITLWGGLTAGDVVDFVINSNTGIQKAGLYIKIRRTS